MKLSKHPLSYSNTKQGVASLYVVIFATILFGVITLSFIRIILSEASQSSNDDLSRSAYDSALAGVEDAKIAVNKYFACMSEPGKTKSDCEYSSLFGGTCDNFNLKNYLYKDSLGPDVTEVKVQESESNNSDQAYTCVILRDEVEDYRTTLSSDTRTKVVPLGVDSSELGKIGSVQISWYSENNGTVFSNLNTHNGNLANAQDATIPPAVTATLIRADDNINLSNYNNSTDGAHYSSMLFLPTDQDGSEISNEIPNSTIIKAGNSNDANKPFQVHCSHDSDFACTVKLTGLDGSFSAGGSAFLVLALPYGNANTDFRVTLFDKDNQPINFKGVQISVDSTGRANQLYRRVETRLDPADTFFPYPEYELDLGSNSGQDAMAKSFWITTNCWTEKGYCGRNNGEINSGN